MGRRATVVGSGVSYIADGVVEEKFAQLMVWLAAATNAKLTAERIRSYAQDLGDVPFDALRAACASARQECQYFPSIPEIRKHLAPSADDAALIAWAGLRAAAHYVGAYMHLDVEDGAAAEAIRVVFGSWAEFCDLEEGPAAALARQEFLAAYRQARREHRPASRLHGLSSSEEEAAAIAERTWAATLTRGGQIVHHRDRGALGPAPDHARLNQAEET